MNSKRRLALMGMCAIIAFVLLSLGCGSSNNANLRLVNASPDENGLNLLVDNTTVEQGVGYGTASAYKSVSAGSRHVQVEPNGSTTPIIDTTVNANSGASLSLVAFNFSFSLGNVLLTDDNSAPTSGNFKLRIVNVSPGLGAQDVYVEPAGTDITALSPTFPNLTFGAASTYSSLAAGNWEVFFTSPGQKFINLDSGSISFSSTQIRTMLALNAAQAYTYTLLADLN